MMRYKQLYVITDTGPPCKNRHAASTYGRTCPSRASTKPTTCTLGRTEGGLALQNHLFDPPNAANIAARSSTGFSMFGGSDAPAGVPLGLALGGVSGGAFADGGGAPTPVGVAAAAGTPAALGFGLAFLAGASPSKAARSSAAVSAIAARRLVVAVAAVMAGLSVFV